MVVVVVGAAAIVAVPSRLIVDLLFGFVNLILILDAVCCVDGMMKKK